MEHGVILLIEAILAIDRKLQKSLGRVVPDLARLRAEPREVLAAEEVVFGPRKPYAMAAVLGCGAGLLVLIGFAISMDDPKPAPAAPAPPDPTPLVTALFATIVTAAAGTALMLSWLRGGWMVLRRQGVEMGYRGRMVFCPWEFFSASGKPYQPDWKRVILPVNPAVPLAASGDDGDVVALWAAEVKTKPIETCAEGQVALRDLYEVRLAEIGELLLHLGRRLGQSGVGAASTGFAATPVNALPVASAEADGRWKVRLTQLPFPPVCFSCGGVTSESVNQAVDSSNHVTIVVPFCGSCQSATRGRRWRGVLVGGAAGVALALAFGVLVGVGQGPALVLVLSALLAVPLAIGGLLVGGVIGRSLAQPVKFSDYSAGAGTVAMRLRDPAGDRAFRSALGLPRPAEAG
jgi:hypothetical protein